MLGVSRPEFIDFKNGGPFFISEEFNLYETVMDLVMESYDTISAADPRIISIIILIFVFAIFLPIILPCQDMRDMDKLQNLSKSELVLQYHEIQKTSLTLSESQYKGLRIQKY
jgi:hypothetical protein